MVTVVETEKTDWGGIKRVPIDEELTVYFAGFDLEDAAKRGNVFKELYDRCGGCEVLKRGQIPTEVACLGRPSVAAYLYSAHEQPIEDIADRLDVSPSTVKQYISDFRHGRR